MIVMRVPIDVSRRHARPFGSPLTLRVELHPVIYIEFQQMPDDAEPLLAGPSHVTHFALTLVTR